MLIKMNNKDEKFYNYMGKQFGSRLIQNQTGDRIYDDDDKEWYINLKDEKVVGFISINDRNVIRNIYSTQEIYIKELLEKVSKDIVISPSVVTKLYMDVYKSCKFIVNESSDYKNFVIIASPENSKKGE